MNTKLLASLEQVMDEWISENCEEDNWPAMTVGGRTAEFMARAAASVLDACKDSQDHAVENGMLFREGPDTTITKKK